MTSIENSKSFNKGFEFSCELRGFPVSFVNALRRILLGNIPTVVVRDVQILENTTQMPHEMLKHRMEMLPIAVSPSDSATIRDARIEVRILPGDARTITTDEFVIDSARPTILMKDRDFDKPLLFVRVRKGESLYMKGRLVVENEQVSQVCNVSTSWHTDAELVKIARKKYEEDGNDVRVFDNSLVQRYYSRDERGRPNWFDLSIESVGVVPAKDLFKMSLDILRVKLDEYMKEALNSISRESDEGTYSVSIEQGGHTLGYLMQEVMYGDSNVNFVSYDIPHPLKNVMVLRFNTKKSPESILRTAAGRIVEYCDVVDNGRADSKV